MANETSGAGGTSGGPQPAPPPPSPSLTREDVFAEMQRVSTDPTHPQHQGWKYQTDAFNAWANSLYGRLPGMAGGKIEFDKLVIGPNGIERIRGVEVVDTTDDAAAQAARAELSNSVAQTMSARGIDSAVVQAEGDRIFGGADGGALLDLLDDRTLSGLAPSAAPQAHVAMAQYLAELAQLRSSATSDDAEGVAPEAFQARYTAALRDRGIDVQTLNKEVEALFVGRPAEYRYFVAQLDKFPADQRLAAYVRSAEAVMAWVRLRQYVA
jgi:hypothetical protein